MFKKKFSTGFCRGSSTRNSFLNSMNCFQGIDQTANRINFFTSNFKRDIPKIRLLFLHLLKVWHRYLYYEYRS